MQHQPLRHQDGDAEQLAERAAPRHLGPGRAAAQLHPVLRVGREVLAGEDRLAALQPDLVAGVEAHAVGAAGGLERRQVDLVEVALGVELAAAEHRRLGLQLQLGDDAALGVELAEAGLQFVLGPQGQGRRSHRQPGCGPEHHRAVQVLAAVLGRLEAVGDDLSVGEGDVALGDPAALTDPVALGLEPALLELAADPAVELEVLLPGAEVGAAAGRQPAAFLGAGALAQGGEQRPAHVDAVEGDAIPDEHRVLAEDGALAPVGQGPDPARRGLAAAGAGPPASAVERRVELELEATTAEEPFQTGLGRNLQFAELVRGQLQAPAAVLQLGQAAAAVGGAPEQAPLGGRNAPRERLSFAEVHPPGLEIQL